VIISEWQVVGEGKGRELLVVRAGESISGVQTQVHKRLSAGLWGSCELQSWA